VLDDPTVNALALPGGYVYVTRGLLAHLNDEAELAAVLGHEIGHVTSRHSVNQISRAILAERSMGIFRVVDPMNQHVGAAMSQRFNMSLLRHSREHEIESDDLAVRYMDRMGYDTRALIDVLDTLARIDAHADGPHLPASQSTHPEPGFRRDRQRSLLAEVPPAAGERHEGRYLAELEGLVFGDDPRRGYRAGDDYVDPSSRLGMKLPSTWTAQTDSEYLAAASPSGAGVLLMTRTRYASPDEAIVEFLGSPAITEGPEWSGPSALDGFLGRRFLLSGRSGSLEGVVGFFMHDGAARMIISLSGGDQAKELLGEGVRALKSTRILTDPKVVAVDPMRIHLVEIEEPISLRKWTQGDPESIPADTLALINHVGAEELIPAGTMVKTVKRFRPPAID
jgi:predicted Zn-dependent protease